MSMSTFISADFPALFIADEDVNASIPDAQPNVVKRANARKVPADSCHPEKPLGSHAPPPSACSPAFLEL
jgi:hypothetical protein